MSPRDEAGDGSADRSAEHTAVVVTDVGRTFLGDEPVEALAGVSLRVPTGALTAVLGPSGCGKTTLLRAIAGTERIDRGSIRVGTRVVARVVDGRPPLHEPPERRHVGLVPQDGALFPHLDAAGNIGFGLRGLDRRARRERIEEMLDLVELRGFGARRPDELSGGERQRVALARALAPRPEVVLLDEPFSALDAALRSALRDEVAELLRRAGTTAVIVTHDRVEAMAIADELAVMRSGRIVQHGRPDDLYRHPADEWTARFLGEAVVLPCRPGRAAQTVVCALGEVQVDGSTGRGGDGTSTVMIRPEQVVPLRLGPGSTVDDPTAGVTARVRSVRFLGPQVVVDLDVSPDDGDAAVDISAVWSSSSEHPSIGDDVVVHVVGRAVRFPTPPSTP